jgi:hypothetical protein
MMASEEAVVTDKTVEYVDNDSPSLRIEEPPRPAKTSMSNSHPRISDGNRKASNHTRTR